VSTGQIIGLEDGSQNLFGGQILIRAAAGTYDVSVRYNANNDTVTVKERELRVRVLAF
jgi:hypothetical protein